MQRKLFLLLAISVSAMMLTVSAVAQQRFVAHLNGIQEVPANNSAGRGVCSVVLNSAETQITVNCTFSGLGSAANAGHIHDNGPVGVNSPVRFNFGAVSGTSGTISMLTFNVTPQQVADLRAKRWYANIHTANFPGGEIRGQVKLTSTVYDRDGDGRTDITVFRFPNRTFYTLSSVNNSLLTSQLGTGTNADIFLNSIADDFDGDGISDPLILGLAPGSTATRAPLYWRVLQSTTGTEQFYEWGDVATANGEKLVPADYDGDGKTDIAVFRSATGIWYILESSTGQPRYEYWGRSGDQPAIGDYDKDGKADVTVVRNEGGQLVWHTRMSRTGQFVSVPWGNAATDSFFFFAPIDVDGDGIQDRMITRTINGLRDFIALRSSDNQPFYLQWGLSSDTPLFGDYDGDGKTDFVARRVENGRLIWYIYQSSNGQAGYAQWGLPSDQ